MILSLEQQVPTLETCQRLRHAGFRQQTLFAWAFRFEPPPRERCLHVMYEWNTWLDEHTDPIAAPTAAELITLLPSRLTDGRSNFWLSIGKVSGGIRYLVCYEHRHRENMDDLIGIHKEDTLAEACALLLLALHERNLVTFEALGPTLQ